MNEKVFKTFDQMCLDKLKELGTATQKEWAVAMGYDTRNAFWRTVKLFVKKGLVTEIKKRPYRYKLKEANNDD